MFSEKEIQFSKDGIKAIYDLKKSFDNWALHNLQDLWNDAFQSGFMQFLLLIESEGKSNGKLAKMSSISKLAMRGLMLSLFFLIIFSCSKESPRKHFYKAAQDGTIALLALKIDDNYFYGKYEVRYKDSSIESGEVRGSIIGDTLKGRFKYITYGGHEKIAPFVLLQRGEVLKMGSGETWTYFNIPYYSSETIKFNDSSFQFHAIDRIATENLNFSTDSF
jgi:hypothetical protein